MIDNRAYNVLIISTNPPSYSGNMGGDIVNALIEAGCKVDYICRFKEPTKGNINPIVLEPKFSIWNIKNNIEKITKYRYFYKVYNIGFQFIKKIYYKIKPYKIYNISALNNSGINLQYYDEARPFFPSKKIIKSIDTKYDFIITLFWHKFINSTTLREIYKEFRIPILIYAIDMAPITGGCQYFKDCQNFINGCGNCPALHCSNQCDQTYVNYLIKKENYNSINCALIGNSWINHFAVKSKLFRASQLFNISYLVDEDEFFSLPKSNLRKKMGIDYSIVLLVRSFDNIRKGREFVIKVLKEIILSLSDELRREIVIITVGDSSVKDALKDVDINIIDMGCVGRKELIKLYQIASFFLSPSIDDAGPSMVNQAMMCGTPIVCFNNGTAVDVVKNKINGFKTDDVSDNGFMAILREALEIVNTKEYEKMAVMARNTALKYNSKRAVASKLIETYKTIKNSDRQH